MWRLIITPLREASHYKIIPICTLSQQVLCVLPHCHFRLWHGDIVLSVGQALCHLDKEPNCTLWRASHHRSSSFNAAAPFWIQVRPSKVEWQNTVFLNPLLRSGLSTKSDYGHLSRHNKTKDTFHSIVKTNNIQTCPIPAAGESKLIHFVWLQSLVLVTTGCAMRHRTTGSTTQRLCKCAQEYSNIAPNPLHTAGSKIMSHIQNKQQNSSIR
jgi:hypothetical protein